MHQTPGEAGTADLVPSTPKLLVGETERQTQGTWPRARRAATSLGLEGRTRAPQREQGTALLGTLGTRVLSPVLRIFPHPARAAVRASVGSKGAAGSGEAGRASLPWGPPSLSPCPSPSPLLL